MSVEPTTPTTELVRPFSSKFFFALLAVAALAIAALVRPISTELLFGAVLAAGASPLYERLATRLRGRREAAAVVFTLAFVVAVLVPILVGAAAVVHDVVEAAQGVNARLDAEGLEGLLRGLPAPLRERLLRIELDRPALQARLADVAGQVLASVGAFLRATGSLLFSLALVIVALVVFLVEGHRIVAWLDEVLPLGRGRTRELLREFRLVGNSVLVGNVGTSAAQALVAFLGYLIAGVPSPLVLAFVTFVFSFVPAIGGAGTSLFAAGLLALFGAPWRAIFLAVWSLGVVGVVDNVVKPLLVKRGVKLHGALVFFAIVAGISAFGASGLLLGPIIVTFALTLVRMDRRKASDDEPAPRA